MCLFILFLFDLEQISQMYIYIVQNYWLNWF